MKISVDVRGIDAAIAQLSGREKQVKFAAAVALTRTAKHAQRLQYDEFKSVFDRPTPMLMKSLFIKPARRDNLESMLYMKDKALGKKNNLSMAEILEHQFTGGARISKQLEVVLRRFNYLGQSEFVVPGSAATLDRYGNMSRGQIGQILSQLKIKSSGYDNAPTSSKRSKKNVARAGTIFWSYGPGGSRKALVDKATGITYGYTGGSSSRLPKGAWVRTGRTVKPLLIAVSGTSYRKRVDMEKIVRRAIKENYEVEFNRALAEALRTAR